MENTTKTIVLTEKEQFDISGCLSDSYKQYERLMFNEIEKANKRVLNNPQNYTQYSFEDAVQMEQYQNTLYTVYRTKMENTQKLINAIWGSKRD